MTPALHAGGVCGPPARRGGGCAAAGVHGGAGGRCGLPAGEPGEKALQEDGNPAGIHPHQHTGGLQQVRLFLGRLPTMTILISSLQVQIIEDHRVIILNRGSMPRKRTGRK